MMDKEEIKQQVMLAQAKNLSIVMESIHGERKLVSMILKIEDKEFKDILYNMLLTQHEIYENAKEFFKKTGRSLDLDILHAEIFIESQKSAPDGPSNDYN